MRPVLIEPSSSEIEGQRQLLLDIPMPTTQPSSSEIEGQRQLYWELASDKSEPSSSEIEGQRQHNPRSGASCS